MSHESGNTLSGPVRQVVALVVSHPESLFGDVPDLTRVGSSWCDTDILVDHVLDQWEQGRRDPESEAALNLEAALHGGTPID